MDKQPAKLCSLVPMQPGEPGNEAIFVNCKHSSSLGYRYVYFTLEIYAAQIAVIAVYITFAAPTPPSKKE